jgi:hypothetical protein
MQNANLKTFFVILAAFSLLIMPCSHAVAQNLPGDHSRWIGDIEGEAVDKQGSALVYEFRFNESGKVTVYKHMTVRKLEQTFDFEMVDGDIRISGDSNGPIAELAGKTIRYVDDKRFAFTHVDDVTDIEIKRSIAWVSWLNIALLFILMMVGNEIASRYKWAPYFFFLVLPILLVPLWMTADLGWFRFAKLGAILIGSMFITISRFNLGPKHLKYGIFLVVFGLAFNIMEAVMQDFSQPYLVNKLSGIAGILNILTIYLWTTIRIDPEKPHNFLWPGMTIAWIIAYDFWNVCFVYLNFPNSVHFTALAVIPAPTIAALFIASGKYTWIQARPYTLSFYMIYVVTISCFDPPVSFVEPLPRSDAWIWTFVGLSLASNVILFVMQWRYRLTGKAPKKLDVGQSAVEGTPPRFG